MIEKAACLVVFERYHWHFAECFKLRSETLDVSTEQKRRGAEATVKCAAWKLSLQSESGAGTPSLMIMACIPVRCSVERHGR